MSSLSDFTSNKRNDINNKQNKRKSGGLAPQMCVPSGSYIKIKQGNVNLVLRAPAEHVLAAIGRYSGVVGGREVSCPGCHVTVLEHTICNDVNTYDIAEQGSDKLDPTSSYYVCTFSAICYVIFSFVTIAFCS